MVGLCTLLTPLISRHLCQLSSALVQLFWKYIRYQICFSFLQELFICHLYNTNHKKCRFIEIFSENINFFSHLSLTSNLVLLKIQLFVGSYLQWRKCSSDVPNPSKKIKTTTELPIPMNNYFTFLNLRMSAMSAGVEDYKFVLLKQMLNEPMFFRKTITVPLNLIQIKDFSNLKFFKFDQT